MATEVEVRKKISALPEATTLNGFYTVGFKMEGDVPKSTKIDLSYVDDAAQKADTKAALADEKATLANTKAALADEKAALAESMAERADEKASEAEAAAGSVDEAKAAAQAAASSASSAAALANQKAGLAEAAAQQATVAAEDCAETNLDIQQAETSRVNAETARVNAESARAEAETARVSAESSRDSAETERNTAETARESAETARENAEEARDTAETEREVAESTRADSETARASAESSRATAESSRVSAESSRVTAEESRVSAESTRVSSEETRNEAEQSRSLAETARGTAEAARSSAEAARVEAENDRGANESARDTAESERSSGETARAAAELARAAAETARVNAEDAREVAETERQASETLRKQAERPYSRIDQVAGPMFDVTYPSLDYAYAKDYFENHAPQVNPAGCSALVKNGVLVRSYDWKRKTADGKTICSFAVHTPAAQGHFAVVGMAGGLDALTEDVVEARQFSEAYKILPFCMQDGKNEKDLFAEMNVVPTWHNTRTVPAVEKRESISAIMLVRYILDNFQTVDEAVAYLQNYVEVYMPTNLDEMGYELHFLIADATKSVAIEFVDNAIVAIETDKLTNFHLSGVTLNEDGSVYTNADVADGNLPSSQGIEDYAGGLERFNILNAATDPVDAIKAVAFSKAYTDLVNVWFSEFVGGDITVNTQADDADFLARIAEYRQKWEDQDNDVWISVHQSVYRFGVAGLDVAIREGNDEHFVPISDHAQAQSDHSLAQSDHSIAQSDHVNEQARQAAETARQQAEVLRENAEDSRETAETARAAAEAARVTEEARRVAEYGQFELDINEGLACIEGHRDLPDWQEDEYGFSLQTWLPGQYCKHPWTNPETHVTKNYVYRFTKAVAEGERWDEDKVVQTSVFGELKELIVGDEENLHVILSSSDGELDVEGLNVNIAFDDGSATRILATNEDGEAGTAIAKGKVFSVQVADQTGYQHVPTQKFKANSNERYVYMIYQKEISSETSNITVALSALSTQQGVTPFVGKTVTLILSNNQSASSVVDSTGVAAFSGIPQGLTGYVILPAIAGFRVPSRIEFSTNYATIGLNAVYTIQTAGLYMVNQDGDEVDFYGWDENDTLIALHIATQELLDKGKDYYVDPSMLDTSWFTSAHNKQWATQNVNFPNVPGDSDTDYDGQSNTTNMLSDAETLGIQSPVAEFWTSQTLTISGNVKLGFGGTKRSWQPMIDNHAAIDDMLLLGGFTPAWYKKSIWVATQNGATNAWIWRGGSWSNGFSKTDSHAAVPFFANN